MGKKKHHKKKVKDLGNISINQVVKVNCGCSSRKKVETKDKEDKRGKVCKCSGFVNGEFIVANICPGCKLDGSFVTFTFDEVNFTATSISKPECFTIQNETYLSTSGLGVVQFNGEMFDVFYTFSLSDLPSEPEIASLILTGTDSTGNTFLFGILEEIFGDDLLNVTPCHGSNCSSKHSRPSHYKMTRSFKRNTTNKPCARMVISQGGQIEEFDLTK
ncbi:hypothetical protein [Halalkalibacter krulwichiae]|uniref:Uncharacterized protein n=1 Tax=Halalkalibacter krulwichiae TaxID=199441 RepID=A0A1X9MC05_9BACI|nr:hypothetical protein [Halalkalibacter krulwichiae]ARK29101.1 hypothetical protein BkAM31D_04125 [Halalkalibacter krulwichiae]